VGEALGDGVNVFTEEMNIDHGIAGVEDLPPLCQLP
jgi:hypothetical protein